MAKNRLFSGQKLSDREIKQIEEQLKKSRERDIAAMEESNLRREKRSEKSRGRRFTNLYKQSNFSSAKSGKEAHDKITMIMDALKENKRDDFRIVIEMSSGDVIDAADYIAENFEPGKAGVYFTVEDLERIKKEISSPDNLPDDDPFKYINT